MPDWKRRLYHQMPPLFRNAAATVRGYQLRAWRYGTDTDQLVEEALARESWPLEQWKAYQDRQLSYVLQRAVKNVPYYKELWAARRRHGDNASTEYLENWDVVEKEAVRQNPLAFLADDCDPRRMYHEHTSGTTGKPISLWWSKDVIHQWYALFEARLRRWYGVDRHMRWAILGGQLITPTSQVKPPFWVWNAALNQLYMSSYHLMPELITYYLEALERYEVEYIYCYTSSAYAIASVALERGLRVPQLRVVITNAEPLFDYQRETISQAFQCPVRESYGMAEIVAAASECEHGALHLWPEVGVTEVQPDNWSTSDLQSGELICTSLLNTDMPLIRYRVGDRGSLRESSVKCRCGRDLRQLASVEGRSDDVLFTRDGRMIGRLDPVFKADLPIQEAQIIQNRLDLIRVCYVPGKDFTLAAEASISARLRERMGDVKVEFEQVKSIPRTNNGKFRAVICNLPIDERNSLKDMHE